MYTLYIIREKAKLAKPKKEKGKGKQRLYHPIPQGNRTARTQLLNVFESFQMWLWWIKGNVFECFWTN